MNWFNIIDKKGEILFGMTSDWKSRNRILLKNIKQINDSQEFKNNLSKIPVLLLDMDWTLIRPKNNRARPKDNTDWTFLYDIEILRSIINKYIDNGYIIGIVSNQSRLGMAENTRVSFKIKVDDVVGQLGIPVYFSTAPKDDLYRKPRTGMWEMMISKSGVARKYIDLENSIMVGDAAGRMQFGHKKADFSASDWKLALNIGIHFETPEVFFQNSKGAIHNDINCRTLGFNPKVLFSAEKKRDSLKRYQHMTNVLKSAKWQNSPLIIMVGSPASGKSAMVLGLFPDHMCISQDDKETNTKAKCKKKAQQILTNSDVGKVIIDNTNRDIKTREYWLKFADKMGIKCSCIWIKTEKPLSLHLDAYRTLVTDKKIPKVALHAYYKGFEKPVLRKNEVGGKSEAGDGERFDKLFETEFILAFPINKKQKKIFTQFLY